MTFTRKMPRYQLEKNSKANNEGTTPRKLQTKRSDSIYNISWDNCCCYSVLMNSDESSTVEFLKLFSKWWFISSSKTVFSTNNYLENTAVNGDQKPLFLRAMAEWVRPWQTERIPNCEKFTLITQTGSALVRTLPCLASLKIWFLEIQISLIFESCWEDNWPFNRLI